MRKKWMKGLLTFVIFVLTAFYLGVQIYRNRGSNYNSETILTTTYSETVEAQVLFLRSEVVVESDLSGALQYTVSDGTKVAKGGVLARIYGDESEIQAHEELELVRSEIRTFETLASQTEIAGTKPDVLTTRLNTRMLELQTALRQNRIGDFERARSGVLEALCQQQLVTGEIDGFERKLTALREQEQQLQERMTEPRSVVTAPLSGYFTGAADGYENVWDLSKIKKITAEEIRSIVPGVPAPNAVGKIADSHIWYAVAVLPPEDARKLDTGASVWLVDPDSDERIPVTVDAVNQSGVDSEAAVVLRGSTLNETISSLRRCRMQLEFHRYSGARVPRDAVHIETCTRTVEKENETPVTEEKELYGVYIIYGEQLKFREISPIYWGEDFVICDLSAPASFNVPVMKLYDQVIIGGKDLYDGREFR